MKLMWRVLFCALLGLCVISQVTSQDFDTYDDEIEDDETVIEDTDDEILPETPAAPKEKPVYKRPKPKGSTVFVEPFHSKNEVYSRWIMSQATKDGAEESVAKYDGQWEIEEPEDNALKGDLSLLLKSKAKHHAISTKLDRPYQFVGNPFIVQYEVRFANGIDCGGAYIKLLTQDSKFSPETFQDKTPYTIMFGPDKCGMDHKLHFIFRHKNPKTGEMEEKHAKKPSGNIDSNFSDKKTHLYTLIVNPDSTFEILIDNALVNQGSLLEDFTPAVNPLQEIEDPSDKKPDDWDAREKIPDPDATKPEDWDEDAPVKIEDPSAVKPDGWLEDESELVVDPDAQKPEDWDDEMDGQWEAPLIDNVKCKEAEGCGPWKVPVISNPNYKGKWKASMIDNPSYQGIWKPRIIPNPDYFEDLEPYKMTSIGALGLELWSMNENIVFDNFIITDDRSVAEAWAVDTWELKSSEERSSSSAAGGMWSTLMSAADEHKWLWAVYVVVLLLPVLLLSICFCPRSGPVKPETIDAHRKKTDEATPDAEDKKADGNEDKKDEEKEAEKEGDKKAENNVNSSGDNRKPVKKRADLEAEENSIEGNEETDEVKETEAAEGSPKQSPRRRRARKE